MLALRNLAVLSAGALIAEDTESPGLLAQERVPQMPRVVEPQRISIKVLRDAVKALDSKDYRERERNCRLVVTQGERALPFLHEFEHTLGDAERSNRCTQLRERMQESHYSAFATRFEENMFVTISPTRTWSGRWMGGPPISIDADLSVWSKTRDVRFVSLVSPVSVVSAKSDCGREISEYRCPRTTHTAAFGIHSSALVTLRLPPEKSKSVKTTLEMYFQAEIPSVSLGVLLNGEPSTTPCKRVTAWMGDFGVSVDRKTGYVVLNVIDLLGRNSDRHEVKILLKGDQGPIPVECARTKVPGQFMLSFGMDPGFPKEAEVLVQNGETPMVIRRTFDISVPRR